MPCTISDSEWRQRLFRMKQSWSSLRMNFVTLTTFFEACLPRRKVYLGFRILPNPWHSLHKCMCICANLGTPAHVYVPLDVLLANWRCFEIHCQFLFFSLGARKQTRAFAPARTEPVKAMVYFQHPSRRRFMVFVLYDSSILGRPTTVSSLATCLWVRRMACFRQLTGVQRA